MKYFYKVLLLLFAENIATVTVGRKHLQAFKMLSSIDEVSLF